MLVAATNPHNPLSWSKGQVVAGTTLCPVTDDVQRGVQVNPTLLLLRVNNRNCIFVGRHMAYGTAPT